LPDASSGAGTRAQQLAGLRRIRRYAVPRWMIERSAERRAAGDWHGACAAADVDVTFDLAEIRSRYGAEVATWLESDLHHLVPDLVRWHAPRVRPGRATLTPGTAIVLSGYGLWGHDAPRLHVTTHPWLLHCPQRLSLRFGPVKLRERPHICTDYSHTGFWRGIVHSWTEGRHLWDSRHTAELRERCGGDAGRVPFLDPDGTPRGSGRLPAADPGPGDPAGHAEWVTMLHERGEVEAAFAAAGIDLAPPQPGSEEFRKWYTVGPLDQLARMPLALTQLEAEMRHMDGGGRFHIPWTQHASVLFEHDGDRGLRAAVLEYDSYDEADELRDATVLAEAVWRRPPDLDLLRHGAVPPEWLHPLVHDALLPARASGNGHGGGGGGLGPPEPAAPAPVRVRCQGEWHRVAFDGGALRLPHGAEEREREDALAALGGAAGGCFAVQRAWRTGEGRLPRALRDLRRDMFDRARHGDTPGLVRLLDQGVDAHVRDVNGRTLLHFLHHLDHDRLLPWLLAAGLDVDAEDRYERTALHRAVEFDGPVALVRALLDAGARIDLQDGEGTTIHGLINRAGRRDLTFLEERIGEEHPELLEY
jgi:hypothetical protein